MAIRSWWLIAACALGAVACASIVRLDASDDPSATAISNDGGASTSSSSSSGGNGADLDGGITTEAGVSLSASVVTFQKVGCNVGQTQDLSVTNTSDAAAEVTISLPADPVFSLVNAQDGALTFTLAPHTTQPFTIAAKSSAAGTASADVLVKLGDEEHHVQVSLETAGGILAVEPPNVDFGTVRLNTASAMQKVVLRNDGTNKITILGFAGASDFALTGTPGVPFPLDPGATVEGTVQLLAGATQTAPLIEELAPTADGLCTETPKLTLKGQRLDAPFTVNPQSADFGDLDCGRPAPTPKALTVSNYENKAKTITLTQKNNPSIFTVAKSGDLAATPDPANPSKATLTISVPTPTQVPADYTDTLTVTVDGKTADVALHIRVRGALLTANPTSLSLRRRNDSSGSGSVTLSNTGNVTACVQYSTSSQTFISEDWGYDCDHSGHNCRYVITDDNDQVSANGSTSWTAKYFSGSSSTVTISTKAVGCSFFSSAAPICGALPKLTINSTN